MRELDLPLLFDLDTHPMFHPLLQRLSAQAGTFERRQFPDGETWLQVTSAVSGRNCVILADLSHPDARVLPLIFLASTLRDFGARRVGLVAPYLCYMRQDIRFSEGEALTSAVFAKLLSAQVDWLVTVDPHLHRYKTLSEIYTIPCKVVQGASVLSAWLGQQQRLLLVGPDAESAQWVKEIAAHSGHPWVTGSKQRLGDRAVQITLPDLGAWHDHKAVIIDDVISSGHTVLQCLQQLQAQGIKHISCACVHGLFVDGCDRLLLQQGLSRLVSTNTVPHVTNGLDVSALLATAVADMLEV